MKNPAVLFYTSDFLTGCSNLTMEERGQYITLLCLQHQMGRLNKKSIDLNVNNISDDVLNKFIIDENNLYYNERMEEETIKRNGFVESRYKNGYKGGRPKKDDIKKPNGKPKKNLVVNHMGNHIGNENDNENINTIKDIILYLNSVLNTNYKYTTDKNKSLIKARLNDGFSIDDFKKVIDKKNKEWKGTEWEKYLRPSTLFGGYFEQYLNQKEKTVKEKRELD